MKKISIGKSGKTGFADPAYYYISLAAGIVFLYLSFHNYTRTLYEHWLVIPCMLFLGALLERRRGLEDKKIFILPAAMVAWLLFLQVRRSFFEYTNFDSIALILSTYLFAFPMASLMKDGEDKKVLKIFAAAYMAGAAVLAVKGILLILDCVPAFLEKEVFWNGARLEMFGHPNIAACILMVGVVLGTTFWGQTKSAWLKMAFSVLLVLMMGVMALTRCRTVVILTGGYLGALLFFAMIKRGRKWFIPGVLTVVAMTLLFYMGAERLYQANSDTLVNKYTQEQSEQIASEHIDTVEVETTLETEERTILEETASPKETIVEKEKPAVSQEDSGEIQIKTNSPQHSIVEDLVTLNSRSMIWSSAFFAIRETPGILYWGMSDPGWYVSYYSPVPIGHLHNAWMQCLVGTGLVGFLIAVVFTVITAWNCLLILLKHHLDIWKRNVALLTLCLMAASVLEPYLFYTQACYHLMELLFFLCAGYLVHWQEDDNRHILTMIRRGISSRKR